MPPLLGLLLFSNCNWFTKDIIGYHLSSQSKIKDSLVKPLYLVSDNDCQPTSLSYMEACSDIDIKNIFTSWSNPKDNADTERVIRTLKEDLVWCYDWDHSFDFQRALGKWVTNYNQDFPLQSLDYQPLVNIIKNILKIKSKY